MEAMSVLENSGQPYREADANRQTLVEGLPLPSSNLEMLKQLALTLLEEIEVLKDIHQLRARDDVHSLNLHDQVRRFEIELMNRALKHTNGHQARAARLLGINVTTFHAKVKRYHLNPHWPDELERTGASGVDTKARTS